MSQTEEANGSEYDHYLIGCREKDVKPLSPWRFRIAYAWYQREAGKSFVDIIALGLKQRAVLMARLGCYKSLSDLVLLGYDRTRLVHLPTDDKPGSLAVDSLHQGQQTAAHVQAEGDEPGAAASGVREPRVPLEPILTGIAARSLPTPDTPDQSFWRV